MVAFHGDKPDLLKQLLNSLDKKLKGLLGENALEAFEPYDVYHIHATLLGMEVDLIDGELYGHWFIKNRQGEKHKLLYPNPKKAAGKRSFVHYSF